MISDAHAIWEPAYLGFLASRMQRQTQSTTRNSIAAPKSCCDSRLRCSGNVVRNAELRGRFINYTLFCLISFSSAHSARKGVAGP